MTASKEQMDITIGPYENIQQGKFLQKSDLRVGIEFNCKENSLRWKLLQEICVTEEW